MMGEGGLSISHRCGHCVQPSDTCYKYVPTLLGGNLVYWPQQLVGQ